MKGGVERERKKADERGRPPLYIYIPWYCPLTLPPLFQSFFPFLFFLSSYHLCYLYTWKKLVLNLPFTVLQHLPELWQVFCYE